MKKTLLLCGAFVAASVLAVACGGSTKNGASSDGGSSGSSSGASSSSSGASGSSSGASGSSSGSGIPPHAAAQNVDLLFMIDNSASMGDKQSLLGLAIPVLL